MIEFLSSWAKNLGVVIVLVSIFEMILPNNKTKKYIRVVLGIFVIFNIIAPFVKNKEKLEISSVDIDNYTLTQNNTVDKTSMNERIQELYEKELENNIKNKLQEQGYKATSCKVKAKIAEEQKSGEENTITKIKLQVEKSEENNVSNEGKQKIENKVVTEIEKIKKVDTTISKDQPNEKQKNNVKSKITQEDVQNIKKILINEYGVKEKCLEIN
ncbi:MAG: hypothetical protein EGQ16_00125 [Clostridiales bacterium]|nr:hypothetical protein [Clostridiales bacterium]